jgi:superfamily II DNA or RNA helicase
MNFDFKPGSLVTLRNRPWVVLPSDNDEDLLLLKPLGGTDEEITGIYKPLASKNDIPESYNFRKPNENDIGDFTSAKLLYNASRLSFRNAAGPFRSLGKISFRPRSYQLVPLIMALKQPKVRLLIADDVGVGKTIEALLIAKELFERKEIKRFAIVCLPHLCDQWQDEIKNKFGIEAVIIRSGTANTLERQIRAHENIFRAFPFQIISIDYIKTGTKRQVFIDHCPELIIVDEAHTCSKPEGANNSQQLRHHLLSDIAKKKDQNIVLLTATPHSGKQAEFQSLLGLLKPEFEKIEIINSTDSERKEIAKYFIQRRRVDVLKWLDEETKFPIRNSVDIAFEFGKMYADVFNEILDYARESIAMSSGDRRKQRYNYWDALALLRGVMSSPAAGASMLLKKAQKKQISNEIDDSDEQVSELTDIMDSNDLSDDNLPVSIVQANLGSSDSESRKLIGYANKLKELNGIENDLKAKEALIHTKHLLERGFNTIIFCRYIQTAHYLGEIFRENLKGKNFKNLHIEVITSELNDELRREKIEEMNKSERRLLIATDCLSEGINLQEGFNSLIHYDLAWNPNRLEQREGRIDRFGQQSDVVEVALLYGSNNPIDGVVLEVLLRKAREIRKSIGISVPFPENSASVMEAVTNAILLKPTVTVKQVSHQLSIFEAEEIEIEKNRVARAFDEAEAREKLSRSRFAQNSIKANELESDLKEIDDAIGNAQVVQDFILDALRFIGVQIDKKKDGFRIYTSNIPEKLRGLLSPKSEIDISFKSPTPAGFKYIGRNHPFVEQLSNTIINDSLEQAKPCAARSAVIRTSEVSKKTVLVQLRVRNVIVEQPTNKQIVAEEMWLWGYRGDFNSNDYILKDEAYNLLMNVSASSNIENSEKFYWLNEELSWIEDETKFRLQTDPVALERSNHLVESHSKFRKLVSGNNYKVVEPVLPMDVLGVYILLPEVK